MAPILLYHAFKATIPFVDAFVNERLRQLLPSANDCQLQLSDRREASMFVDICNQCVQLGAVVRHGSDERKSRALQLLDCMHNAPVRCFLVSSFAG